jgi:hypothetical protein
MTIFAYCGTCESTRSHLVPNWASLTVLTYELSAASGMYSIYHMSSYDAMLPSKVFLPLHTQTIYVSDVANLGE